MATATADAFQSFPLPISHLSLPVVLKCGQSFRWSKVEHPSSSASEPEWRLTLQDRVVCLRQTPTTLLYRAIYPSSEFETEGESRLSTLHWLKDYFQLEVDLIKLFSEVKDPVFQNAVKKFEGGIRILRQDPWENLLSFICSQNNHISRITGMVQNLCTHFSDSLLVDTPPDSLPIPYYPFPSPQLLSDPSVDASLRGLGFGYRAKYIQKTAAMLCEEHDNPQEWLLSLRDVPTAQAREELLRLPGVGPKVADCILLMSLDKHEVVPIDTHMLQIAMKHYNFRVPGHSGKGGGVPPMTPKLHIEVSAKLQKIWGPYAGWAQGVLFTSDLKAFS
ncbi:DNA glycosylase, partial [Clavulina sp. PMI_390]